MKPTFHLHHLSILITAICLCLCALQSVQIPPAQADVPSCSASHSHTGTIAADERWCADGGHTLTGDVTVASAATLTIDPGVTVTINTASYGLTINGTLNAVGTTTNRITFTRGTSVYWEGITFNGGVGHLQNATVGYARTGVHVSSTPTAQEVIIEDCQILADSQYDVWYGMVWVENGGRLTLRNSTISGSRTYYHDGRAVMVSGAASRLTLEGNTITDNTLNRIYLLDHAMTGADVHLVAQNGLDGYELGGTYTVPLGVTLSVDPGIQVLMKQTESYTLIVNGHLQAVGTAALPITFVHAPTHQSRIRLEGAQGGGTAVLDYVRFTESNQYYPTLEITDVQAAPVAISHCEFAGGTNARNGLYVKNSRVSLTGTSFHNYLNASKSYYPLIFEGSTTQAAFAANTFQNNTNSRVQLRGNALSSQDFTFTANEGLTSYDFKGSMTVPSGKIVTVEPGVKLRGQGMNDPGGRTGILVEGQLNAIGTADRWITLTSISESPSGDTSYWDGITFQNGGSGHLRYIQAIYGVNPVAVMADSSVLVENSRFSHGFSGNLYSNKGQLRLINSVVDQNWYDGTHDNEPGMIIAGGGAQLEHVTFTNTAGIAIDASADVLNCSQGCVSIQAKNLLFANVGVAASLTEIIGAGSFSLDGALFDEVTSQTSGSVALTHAVTGSAAFSTDGYHLTEASMAADRGIPSDVITDIDGETRPQGTAADLGADELAQGGSNPQIRFSKTAWAPNFMMQKTSTGGMEAFTKIVYQLQFVNQTTETQALTLTDSLPAGLVFTSEKHYPDMLFTPSGQGLTWTLTSPLPAGQVAMVILSTRVETFVPNQTIENAAEAVAHTPGGIETRTSSASVLTPIYKPIIAYPQSGEVCSEPDGRFKVSGAAQPGALVQVLENGAPVSGAQAITAGDGTYQILYTSTLGNSEGPVDVAARACRADGSGCTDPTAAVSIRHPAAFWCPQRSSYTFDDIAFSGIQQASFRANGEANSLFFNFFHSRAIMKNNHLRLYACNCPAPYRSELPTAIWVTLNNRVFQPTRVDGRWVDFDFGDFTTIHQLSVHATCHEEVVINLTIRETIDPDGFVYNASRGFDPASLSTYALSGATITAYVYLDDWGGWTPWPAALYGQQNPQVTGSSGYFAFFTPPGQYYLEAKGLDGFQGYRSPVIEVVDQVVHWNIPLAPFSLTPPAARITVTPNGFDLPLVKISAGQSLEWVSALSQFDPDPLGADYLTHPILRLLTGDPAPVTPMGWDSGLLPPGSTFQRTFNIPGAFSYTDGNGHTGQVVVDARVYLPNVLR